MKTEIEIKTAAYDAFVRANLNLTDTAGNILLNVAKHFGKLTPGHEDSLSAYEIFIFAHHTTGQILYNDRFIPNVVFQSLLSSGKIEYEGCFMHQVELSARYKFVGHKYPKRFYTGYYKPKLSDYSKVLKP